MTPNPIPAVVYSAALIVGGWFVVGGIGTSAKEVATTTETVGLSPIELLDGVRTKKLPEGLELPAFYRDPTLIGTLKQSAFTSPSPLVKLWLQTPQRQKFEILAYIVDAADPMWLFAFLGEVAYVGITLEPDVGMARLIVAAVQSTSVVYAQPALFLLDHIGQVCPHDAVRSHAAENARAIRNRIRALGH
ncbi:MAG: hypothetical protein H6834_05505 [Planctomycetes bacterium]|nr:hypothetical protein [Planctomycetota bacterium]MCB9890855.1 hypothetical protein [Planctomycetota bacterium]